MPRFLIVLLLFCYLSACEFNNTAINLNSNEAHLNWVVEPNTMANEWQRIYLSLDSLHPLLPAALSSLRANEKWVLIAHLGIHSGLPRMVLWNVKENKIADSGLVAHGYGSEVFSRKAVFSNTPNSYCSSPGKYLVGGKYKGNFGWSYKLNGFDKTNSKAFERFIVLHPYTCVPDAIVYPDYCCNSQGCPMISYAFMERLSKTIDGSAKPLLLWIIE